MMPYHYFYDFKIGADNLGFFEIKFENNIIYQNAKFHTDHGLYDSPFYLRIKNDQIYAFKKGSSEWKNLDIYSENHFPSSAYPLLLTKVQDRLEYFQINEESGEIVGLTILERHGNTISEYREHKLVRSFEMQNDVPVKINWGGATSSLKTSLKDAMANSPLEINAHILD